MGEGREQMREEREQMRERERERERELFTFIVPGVWQTDQWGGLVQQSVVPRPHVRTHHRLRLAVLFPAAEPNPGTARQLASALLPVCVEQAAPGTGD